MLFVLLESMLMVVVSTKSLMDDCCYLLVPSAWLLVLLGAFWMVAVISWWCTRNFSFSSHVCHPLQCPNFSPCWPLLAH